MFSLFWPSSFAVWKADKVKPTGTKTKGKIRVPRENRSLIAVKNRDHLFKQHILLGSNLRLNCQI